VQPLCQALDAGSAVFTFLDAVTLIRCDVSILGPSGLLAAASLLPRLSSITIEFTLLWGLNLHAAYSSDDGGAAPAHQGAAQAAKMLWCATAIVP
jgi:hypothetical protein